MNGNVAAFATVEGSALPDGAWKETAIRGRAAGASPGPRFPNARLPARARRLASLLGRAYDGLASIGRLVFLDLLGFAGSERPSGRYGMDHHISAIRNTLGELEVADAIVVGHSSGGLIAMALGAHYSNLVSSVVGFGVPIFPSENAARKHIRSLGFMAGSRPTTCLWEDRYAGSCASTGNWLGLLRLCWRRDCQLGSPPTASIIIGNRTAARFESSCTTIGPGSGRVRWQPIDTHLWCRRPKLPAEPCYRNAARRYDSATGDHRWLRSPSAPAASAVGARGDRSAALFRSIRELPNS
jgi:pimeloyl-ACP methyl ester carboxylesterase